MKKQKYDELEFLDPFEHPSILVIHQIVVSKMFAIASVQGIEAVVSHHIKCLLRERGLVVQQHMIQVSANINQCKVSKSLEHTRHVPKT